MMRLIVFSIPREARLLGYFISLAVYCLVVQEDDETGLALCMVVPFLQHVRWKVKATEKKKKKNFAGSLDR